MMRKSRSSGRTQRIWLLMSALACLALTACAAQTGPAADDAESVGDITGDSGVEQAADQEAPELPMIECPPGGKQENALLLFPDILEMTLLTEVSGGGARPLLEWEPVEGADHYSLVLYTSAGEPYWAWIGFETAIYVAGTVERPPADSEGPVVTECMAWITTAYDDDGVPIAAGGPRPLSP